MEGEFRGPGIEAKPKPRENVWVTKLRYNRLILVRISVHRMESMTTDEWDAAIVEGENMAETLVREMRNSPEGFGVTGLRRIEKWCLANGAVETTNREIRWGRCNIYFAFLYSNLKRDDGEYPRGRGYNGKNKDHG